MKVLMAAPYNPKGRYKGGISSIVTEMLAHKDLLQRHNLDIVPFDTCRVSRDAAATGKMKFQNIQNALCIMRDLPKNISETQAKIVYYHTSVKWALLKDLLAVRKAKKKIGVFTVIHIHFAEYNQIMTGNKVIDSYILRLMKRYVDRIVFLSSKTKDEFVERGILEDKCKVIYNFSTLHYKEEELALSQEKTSMEFLFVGSIDNRKGIFDALDVLSKMDKPFTFHICGTWQNEENEEKFKHYANLLGEKLVYHGYVSGEKKRELFQKADVLLLPSYGEGLPVVILEAFSAGCAVVASNVGAIPEIVNGNSELVLPGDKDGLMYTIESYYDLGKQELIKQKQINYQRSFLYTLDKFVENVAIALKLERKER